jgi:hypothetical protein
MATRPDDVLFDGRRGTKAREAAQAPAQEKKYDLDQLLELPELDLTTTQIDIEEIGSASPPPHNPQVCHEV